MYLVFTTNWGHKNKNYLQIINNNNNNNNVYTIKICGMYKLYNKTIGILLLFKSDVRSFFLMFFLKDSIFEEPFNLISSFDHI